MEPDPLMVENSLELLGRRLRMLGFDVESAGAVRLEQLFERARDRRRIALTASARRPRRCAGVRALTVPLADPAAALRIVVAGCVPAGAPFTRCPRCNVPLESRPAADARGRAPGDVVSRGHPLWHCAACGRWFWEGSHTGKLRAWLAAALGGASPGPAR